MSENFKIENKIFPATEHEALALSYVNAQDLSGKSPAEIYHIYHNALKEIKDEHDRVVEQGRKEKAEKRKRIM